MCIRDRCYDAHFFPLQYIGAGVDPGASLVLVIDFDKDGAFRPSLAQTFDLLARCFVCKQNAVFRKYSQGFRPAQAMW